MLRPIFDPKKSLKVVLYLRMSSERQNPRSPQQQRDNIEATLRRLGYNWTIVGTYTDSAISGRYKRKRRQFQQMLHDIRGGAIHPDAILVDTFERFGRAEELLSIRRELHVRHGVLILTADSQFSDPTTATGQMMSTFESVRSTEDNRIKGLQVLRGKRDAARQGHWPGGTAPFGYRLESVMVERDGRQELDYCRLVPDLETAGIIKRVYALAYEQGLGCTRIAQALNEAEDISSKHKPFYDQTVNYWLKQTIYKGELLWEKHTTDIIEDRRVIQRKSEEEMIRVPNFCEPLISDEVWSAVQTARQTRQQARQSGRKDQASTGAKIIAPLLPGLALTYPLSGLVQCGHCHRAMTISRSSDYTTKTGEVKNYPSYHCPGYSARVCPNSAHLPEPWLREQIARLVRERLFSFDSDTESS